MSLTSLFRKKNIKALFTTPSHDGKLCIFHKFYQWYRCDISEVDAYNPQAALEKAEKKAAEAAAKAAEEAVAQESEGTPAAEETVAE